jgi:hypothetical protein
VSTGTYPGRSQEERTKCPPQPTDRAIDAEAERLADQADRPAPLFRFRHSVGGQLFEGINVDNLARLKFESQLVLSRSTAPLEPKPTA